MSSLFYRICIGLAALGLIGAGLVLRPPHLTPPARGEIILTHVHILNPSVEILHDQTVIVRDGRILAIRPASDSDPAPMCENCWIMPGLIDAHVHTPPRTALGMQSLFSMLYLANGVTSVRDTGQSGGSIAALRRRIASGRMIGPHMMMCGPVLEGEPAVWQVGQALTDPDQARARVEVLAASGVDCIKVYNTLSPEVFASIAAAAQAAGLPLVGHVPHAVGLRNVHDMNVQHMTGIPYAHGRPAPALNDWDPADLLAMSETEIMDVVEIARTNGLSFTPTLINSHRRLVASDPGRWPRPEAMRRLPDYFVPFWQVGMGHPETATDIAGAVAEWPLQLRIAALLHQGGIPVLAGTDTLMPFVLPGEALQAEVKLLARAFGDNEAALASATTLAALHLGSEEIGRIRIGARADLLVLNTDPRADLAALDDWSILVADGRIYSRASLEAGLDRYQTWAHSWLYSAVMGFAIRIMTGGYSASQGDG